MTRDEMLALAGKMEDFLNEPQRKWDIEPIEVRDYRHEAYRVWEPICRIILNHAAQLGQEGEG